MIIDSVSIPFALVFCLALIVMIIFAKLVGCILPLLAKRLGFDIAVLASLFITNIVDSLSLIFDFHIATHLLRI